MIHHYGERNHFFFLWVTLVTERLEIQFNPSSREEEEIPEIDCLRTGSCLLGRGGDKGDLWAWRPSTLSPTCEPKPTLS